MGSAQDTPAGLRSGQSYTLAVPAAGTVTVTIDGEGVGFRFTPTQGCAKPDGMSGSPSAVGAPVLARIRPEALTITQALEAWHSYMLTRGKRRASADCYGERIRDAARFCGWGRIEELSVATVEEYLAAKRAGIPADPEDPQDKGVKPWSGGTFDHAVSCFRSFGRFLHRTERLPSNPFDRLEAMGRQDDDGARALTVDEAKALIAAANLRLMESGRARKGSPPLFWAFLCLTGLRYSEAAALRWRNVSLTEATYTTDRDHDKSGKSWTNPVCAQVVEILRLVRPHDAAPDSPVWSIVPVRKTFQVDRERAGIAYKTREGECTPHACRKGFATWIDSTKAPIGVTATLMRHRSGITLGRYIRPEWPELVRAVNGLPTVLSTTIQIHLTSGSGKPILSASGRNMLTTNPQQSGITEGGVPHSQREQACLTTASIASGAPSSVPSGVGRDAGDSPRVVEPVCADCRPQSCALNRVADPNHNQTGGTDAYLHEVRHGEAARGVLQDSFGMPGVPPRANCPVAGRESGRGEGKAPSLAPEPGGSFLHGRVCEEADRDGQGPGSSPLAASGEAGRHPKEAVRDLWQAEQRGSSLQLSEAARSDVVLPRAPSHDAQVGAGRTAESQDPRRLNPSGWHAPLTNALSNGATDASFSSSSGPPSTDAGPRSEPRLSAGSSPAPGVAPLSDSERSALLRLAVRELLLAVLIAIGLGALSAAAAPEPAPIQVCGDAP